MTLPDGEIEEKYELLSELKEGGMGAIYKVRHKLLDEVRVIKVIRRQHADDPGLQQRFQREARTAIQLRHPNIAEIFDFSTDSRGHASIVMEFIDGIDLKQLLKSGGPPPLPLVMEIADQGLRALGYLHQRGFLHRDISLDNLMLSSDHDGQPLVKLIDMGIAKRLGGDVQALTATGMFVGKVQYTAPEQFQRDLGDDPRSDLYSFGVLLYELLTGHSPIVGDNITELITSHVLHPPRSFEQTDPEGRVPVGLRTTVMKALEKKPADRHVDAAAFADALEGFKKPDTLASTLETTLSLPLIPHQQDELEAGSGITDLLSGARHLVEQRQFDKARTLLDRALALAPHSTKVRRLLEAVEKKIESPADDRLRGRLTHSAQRIDELIDAGHLDQAESQLQAAVNDHGDAMVLRQIRYRLNAARHAQQQLSQLTGRLHDAQKLAEAGELAAAEENLLGALARDPKLSKAEELLGQVRDAQAQLSGIGPPSAQDVRSLPKAPGFSEAPGIPNAPNPNTVVGAKRDDDPDRTVRLEDAGKLIAAEVAKHNSPPQDGAREMLVEARALAAGGRFNQAEELLQTVLQLQPGHEKALYLLKDIDHSRRQEEGRRQAQARRQAQSLQNRDLSRKPEAPASPPPIQHFTQPPPSKPVKRLPGLPELPSWLSRELVIVLALLLAILLSALLGWQLARSGREEPQGQESEKPKVTLDSRQSSGVS